MSDAADIKAALDKEEADQKAEQERRDSSTRWKQENEGDELSGTLVDGEWVHTKYGRTRVLTIQDADGKLWTFWVGDKVLGDEMDTKAPAIGSAVGFRFKGKQKPKVAGGYEWNGWAVYTEKSDHEHWRNSFKAMIAKQEQKETEAMGGSGLAPGGSSAMEDPY